jgi:hypothetical protein
MNDDKLRKELVVELKEQFLTKIDDIKKSLEKKEKEFLISQLDTFISSFLVLDEVHLSISLKNIYNWVSYEQYDNALKEFISLESKLKDCCIKDL